MKRRKILKASLLAYLLFMLTMNSPICQDIEIEEKAYHKEITVHQNKDFTVHLQGSGWYLNRYDRKNLSFKMRRIEPRATYFTMRALNEGSSYMLFSYREKDVYVMVKISSSLAATHKHISDPADPVRLIVSVEGKNVEKENNGQESRPVAEGENEHRSGGSDTPNEITQKRKPKENGKAEKKTEDKEIYYTTKDNEVVRVPYSSENDEYFAALRFLKTQNYDRGLNSLEQYLSHCKKCTYRDDAYLKIADLFITHKKQNQAIKYLSRLTDSPSLRYRKEAHRRIAELYFSAGNLQDALQDYKKAYEYDPKDTEILKEIGGISYSLHRYEDAVEAYEQLFDQGYHEEEILFRLATIYDSPGEMRNVERAYKYYRKIVETYSNSDHFAYSKERVQFFEKNFYQYK